MSRFRSSVLLVSLAAALSCSREPQVPETPRLVHHVISASAGEKEEPVQPKGVIDPSNDTQLLWTAHEKVMVFEEAGIAPYLFTGTNASKARTALFEGDTPGELGSYTFVSPYDAAATGGSEFTTWLSPVQEGMAGSFSNGTAIMAGQYTSSPLVCRHVCSGMRFKVAASNIAAVSFKGNQSEMIAGQFTFQLNEGIPEIISQDGGTENEVVLRAPGGGTFSPDTWYYLTILPTSFPGGFTVTAYSTEGKCATYKVSSDIEFKRGGFKEKANLDAAMVWNAISPTVANTAYGPANSFTMQPGGSLDIDVSPRLILPGWLRSPAALTGAASPDGCEILWQTDGGEVSARLDGHTLKISAGTGSADARALVAIKKESLVLWSYLVWVSASDPLETALPGGITLQERLGGSDIVFQWGRKDPLRSDDSHADNQDDGGLAYSLSHPDAIIDPGDNAYDWFTDTPDNGDARLWGGKGIKTVWDPCPQGWRVPCMEDFTGFASENLFDTYHWTASARQHDTYAYSIHGISPKTSSQRYLTMPVRCVKE